MLYEHHAGHGQHQLVGSDESFGAVGIDSGGKRCGWFAGHVVQGQAPVEPPHRHQARIQCCQYRPGTVPCGDALSCNLRSAGDSLSGSTTASLVIGVLPKSHLIAGDSLSCPIFGLGRLYAKTLNFQGY